MKHQAQKMLNDYLATLTNEQKANIPNLNNITDEYFCNDEYNANECARLVNIGKKTATCSLKEAWDFDNEPYPQVGELKIITNWHNEPICIIQLTEVKFAKFSEVTAEFAQAEGEGDGSYEWWQQAHIEFFTEYAKTINSEFNENSELVLERFKKMYPL